MVRVELQDHRGKVSAIARQDGDFGSSLPAFPGPGLEEALNSVPDGAGVRGRGGFQAIRVVIGVGVERCSEAIARFSRGFFSDVPVKSGVRPGGPRGGGGDERDVDGGGCQGGVVGRGKDLLEGGVKSVDQGRLRAEVCGQAKGIDGELAEEAVIHHAAKAFHTRLPELIDGLLGVADEEEGLRHAVPASGECLEKLILAGGGVLHFVDEQMLEAADRAVEEVRGG